MYINPNLHRQIINQNLASSESKERVRHSLPENAEIKGEVLSLNKSEITISLSDGHTIEGKILNPELVSIGMNGKFSVTETENGELQLKLLPDAKQSISDNSIEKLLNMMGFKANAENIKIVNLLIENSYPVTKDTFAKLNQAMKLTKDPEKAIFILNNELKPNFKTSNQIEAYSKQELKLSSQLSNLMDKLFSSAESEVSQKILTDFTQNSSEAKELISLSREVYSELDKDIISESKNLETQEELIIEPTSKKYVPQVSELENFISANKAMLTNIVRAAIIEKNIDKLEIILSNISNGKFKPTDILKTFLNENTDLKNTLTQTNDLKDTYGVLKEILADTNPANLDTEQLNSDINKTNNLPKEIQQTEKDIVLIKSNTSSSHIENAEISNNNEIIKAFAENNNKELINLIKTAVSKKDVDFLEKEINNLTQNKFDAKDIIREVLADEPITLKKLSFLYSLKDYVSKNNSDLLSAFKSSVIQGHFDEFAAMIKPSGFSEKDIFSELFKNKPEVLKNAVKLQGLKTSVKSKFLKSISLSPSELTKEEATKTLKNLLIAINKAENQVNTDSQTAKVLSDIKDNLSFASQMKDTAFIQLPMLINDNPSTVDLYVFNNKKNKKGDNDIFSALISLDMAYLGLVETYVQRNSNNINCQFRLAKEGIQALITENLSKLQDYLKNYDYNLTSVTYKKIDEPFNITKNEPIENEVDDSSRNYSFDMRT